MLHADVITERTRSYDKIASKSFFKAFFYAEIIFGLVCGSGYVNVSHQDSPNVIPIQGSEPPLGASRLENAPKRPNPNKTFQVLLNFVGNFIKFRVIFNWVVGKIKNLHWQPLL